MSPAVSSAMALKNKSAAIACSSEKASSLAAGLEAMGAAVLTMNVITLEPIADNRKLEESLGDLGHYEWIIITSTFAAQIFARRLRQRGVSLKERSTPRLCAVGPATKAELVKEGLAVDLIPDEFVAEGIVQALERYHGGPQGLTGRNFLLPRALEARDALPQALEEAGAAVDIVPCYRNVPGTIPKATVESLETNPPDLLVFTSSSTVRNFVAIVGTDQGRRLFHKAKIAALGPITAAAIEAFGKKPEILPQENTIPSLLEAIRRHFSG
jgi:uroporphyrinogen III methyltransferase / synthase